MQRQALTSQRFDFHHLLAAVSVFFRCIGMGSVFSTARHPYRRESHRRSQPPPHPHGCVRVSGHLPSIEGRAPRGPSCRRKLLGHSSNGRSFRPFPRYPTQEILSNVHGPRKKPTSSRMPFSTLTILGAVYGLQSCVEKRHGKSRLVFVKRAGIEGPTWSFMTPLSLCG